MCTVHEALERLVNVSVRLVQYAVDDAVEFPVMLDTRYVTLTTDDAGVGAGMDAIDVALIGPKGADESVVTGCAAAALLLLETTALS